MSEQNSGRRKLHGVPCDPAELARLSKLDSRWRYLPQWGDFSIAYGTLDRELQSFELPGSGYIAFATVAPDPVFPETTLAVGSPVCSPEGKPALVDAFIESHRDERGHGPGFLQVDEESARLLSERGYYITQLGIETRVDLQEWSLDGHGRRMHRAALHHGRASGCVIEDLTVDRSDVDDVFRSLPWVSERWIATHAVGDKEAGFLTRHAVYDHEPFVRKAVLRDDQGSIIGFAAYDPLFTSGHIVGYVSSITRYLPTAFRDARRYVDVVMLERFREEGVRWFELGLSPCYQLERVPPPLRWGRVAHRLLRTLYEQGESIYAFKGLAVHKGIWHAEEVPTYLAFPVLRPIQHLLAGFKLIGLEVPSGVAL